mgnify:CR=1 FL=1
MRGMGVFCAKKLPTSLLECVSEVTSANSRLLLEEMDVSSGTLAHKSVVRRQKYKKN